MEEEEIQLLLKKKCVHVALNEDLHKNLRVNLFLDGITINEFFEKIALLYVNDNQNIKCLIPSIKKEIKEQKLDKLRNINKKDIYEQIENLSPIK